MHTLSEGRTFQGHKNNVNLQKCDAVHRNKEVKKHLFEHMRPQCPEESEKQREKEVLWIMNGQHCTTDALLLGAVQSSGILLILRKRLAGSFPVY